MILLPCTLTHTSILLYLFNLHLYMQEPSRHSPSIVIIYIFTSTLHTFLYVMHCHVTSTIILQLSKAAFTTSTQPTGGLCYGCVTFRTYLFCAALLCCPFSPLHISLPFVCGVSFSLWLSGLGCFISLPLGLVYFVSSSLISLLNQYFVFWICYLFL